MTESTATPVRMAASERVPFGMAAFISTAVYLALAAVTAYLAATDATGGASVTPKTGTASTLQLFWHNLGVLVWLATGLCSAGLLTVGVLGINGVLLGWVVGKQIASGDLHPLLTGLLPHFPFEIGAYVISAAASFRLGIEVASRVRRSNRGAPLPWQAWAKVQAIAVGLLLIAAIVEANFAHV